MLAIKTPVALINTGCGLKADDGRLTTAWNGPNKGGSPLIYAYSHGLWVF